MLKVSKVLSAAEKIDPKAPYVVIDTTNNTVVGKFTYKTRNKAKTLASQLNKAAGGRELFICKLQDQ